MTTEQCVTEDVGAAPWDGQPALVATIIDVVGSRTHEHQLALLRGVADRVERLLVREGRALSAGPSVGDELQSLHDDVGAAVLDLARLRLSLLVDPPTDRPVEVRAGIGVGEVVGGGDATAPAQSGTAWWSAREALGRAARHRNAWPRTRWWAVGAGPGVAAALVATDTLFARLDGDDRRAALALLDGASASAIAAELGVVPSTLSSRLHGHGVYGLVRTLQVLAGGGDDG